MTRENIYPDEKLVTDKFREARFFLGNMELANQAFGSRNIVEFKEDEFRYYLDGFSGAIYSIDDYISKSVEDTLGLKECVETDTEVDEKTFELFNKIRNNAVHLVMSTESQQFCTPDAYWRYIIKVNQDFCFRFREESDPRLFERYGEQGQDTVYVPVVELADEYLWAIHGWLNELKLINLSEQSDGS
jgi:hypothetical protein